jgi:hypothetical protein
VIYRLKPNADELDFKTLNVTARCIRCLFPGLEAGSPHQFRFDGLEDGFDHGIIIAITLATHRGMHAMGDQ